MILYKSFPISRLLQWIVPIAKCMFIQTAKYFRDVSCIIEPCTNKNVFSETYTLLPISSQVVSGKKKIYKVTQLRFFLRNWPEGSAADPATGHGFSTRGAPAPRNPHPLIATILRAARTVKVTAKTSRTFP
jgi:hypothetical protein